MRLVFFGSDDFAAVILKALISSEHDVCAVVTKPDAQKGRGRKFVSPVIKTIADEAGISCFQPVDLKDDSFNDRLSSQQADMFVVVSYGKIIPDSILDIPALGCLNVHPSLLPKYRGSAPVNYALLNGDKVSGVSFIDIVSKVDSGDIYFQEEHAVSSEINAVELLDEYAHLSAERLPGVLDQIEKGEVTRVPQDESAVSFAPKMSVEMGKIDWSFSAEKIHDQIRALLPWPCAFSSFQEKKVKIYKSSVCDEDVTDENGSIVEIDKKNQALKVKCGEGVLAIYELQMEGKKRMNAFAWANGQRIKVGECFV